MRKLISLALGGTLTLLSAAPALAQSVEQDMVAAVQARVALTQDLAEVAQATASAPALAADEAVLGEQALPVLGVEAPIEVRRDLLIAVQDEVRENRAMASLPSGGSTD